MTAGSRTRLALAGVLTTALLAGCGGDDPAPEEAASKTTTTATGADDKADAKSGEQDESAPSEPVLSVDREKIVAVLGKMEAAINDGDAGRLCSDVYAFGDDTTRGDCVKVFGTVIEASDARAQITLRSVQRKGDRATVNVVNRSVSGGGSTRQTFRFIKRNDAWRVLFD